MMISGYTEKQLRGFARRFNALWPNTATVKEAYLIFGEAADKGEVTRIDSEVKRIEGAELREVKRDVLMAGLSDIEKLDRIMTGCGF